MLTRLQRRRYYLRRKILIISIVTGIAVLFAGWAALNRTADVAVPAAATAAQTTGSAAILPKWNDILLSGLPQITGAPKQQQAVRIAPEVSAQSVLRGMMLFFTSVDIKDIRSLFHTEIPLIATIKTGTPTVSAMSLPNFPKFDPASLTPAGQPLIGIYHTHTAESFIPTSGAAHRPGGQQGDIVAVGETLAKQLEKHGIPAIQSKAIHDYPSFMKAYGASEITAKKMLTDYPSLQMLFDIHRDADKHENYTAVINGNNAARITIVVATGQPDLVQPHWQENHAFAKLIDAKLNQHYPGLSKGILLTEWRYNQQLHPRALLLEVGCQENTLEEAERSMEMLGDVLAEIMAENNGS